MITTKNGKMTYNAKKPSFHQKRLQIIDDLFSLSDETLSNHPD